MNNVTKSFSFKFWFNFMTSGAGQTKQDYRMILETPLAGQKLGSDARLMKIIRKNERPITGYGMTGAYQMFENLTSKESMKRRAAENILAHRNCVVANRKMGRTYRGSHWLDRAATARQGAM